MNHKKVKVSLLIYVGSPCLAANHSILLRSSCISYHVHVPHHIIHLKEYTRQLHTPTEGLSWQWEPSCRFSTRGTMRSYTASWESCSLSVASASTKRTNFATGLVNKHDLFSCLFPTLSLTFLTKPSSEGNTSSTLAMGYPLRFVKISPSIISTMSPTNMFLDSPPHFCLSWRLLRYSALQRDQNWFARYWTLR